MICKIKKNHGQHNARLQNTDDDAHKKHCCVFELRAECAAVQEESFVEVDTVLKLTGVK